MDRVNRCRTFNLKMWTTLLYVIVLFLLFTFALTQIQKMSYLFLCMCMEITVSTVICVAWSYKRSFHCATLCCIMTIKITFYLLHTHTHENRCSLIVTLFRGTLHSTHFWYFYFTWFSSFYSTLYIFFPGIVWQPMFMNRMSNTSQF